jgi:hypothetical protein
MKPIVDFIVFDGTLQSWTVPDNTMRLLFCASLGTELVWGLRFGPTDNAFQVPNRTILQLDDPNLANRTIYVNGEGGVGALLTIMAFLRTIQ